MSRELNKIFDVKSRQARRDILDKFDLSKEDKNKVLNKIDSAGGESGGSGSVESNAIYYKFSEPFYLQDAEMFIKEVNIFSGARGYYDKSYGYYYGTAVSVKTMIGARFSSYGYMDALEFRPIQFLKSWGDMSIITYNDFESLAEAFPDIFGGAPLSRITAEEYWQYYNPE